MVSFIVYDLSFLVLFTIFIFIFLYKNRRKLGREGIIFMYRTQVGVKLIKYVGDTFSKVLHKMKHVVIGVGFILMGIMLYLLGFSFYKYISDPLIFQLIKAPPIAPLIPYFPELFGMQSYFPPFYFTYFIIALLIVAVVHEFSHGIFMRLFKIKIKSTGFIFLGPILGAFVEQDDNQMKRESNFNQMTILAAGVFANLIFAVLFFILLLGFFNFSYVESGYKFNTYAYSIVPKNQISGYGNFSEPLTEVYVQNRTYYLDEELKQNFNKNLTQVILYEGPAVKSQVKGAIVEIDNSKISNQKELEIFLSKKSPGEIINLKTEDKQEEINNYELILGEHPFNNSKAYLGVGFIGGNQQKGIFSKVVNSILYFKDPAVYYKPTWNRDVVEFIYNFLWWVAIINLLVALFNMLPLGILDGGRFLYLTIFSITKSKNFAKIFFKIISYAILLIFVLMLLFWIFKFF